MILGSTDGETHNTVERSDPRIVYLSEGVADPGQSQPTKLFFELQPFQPLLYASDEHYAIRFVA